MRRRFYQAITAGAALIGTGGCVQMTRHSNTMLFGTNTVFGIAAGQDANSVPSVTVGYKRQEAVIMPLVANTVDDNGVLKPCPLNAAQPNWRSGEIHPCLLVAHNDEAQDSYSVLASFGAQFDASGTNANVKGGLAQYFATGVAAQILALRGGSSLVATGSAATASAAQSPDSASLAVLLGNEDVKKAATAEYAASQSLTAELVLFLAKENPADFDKQVLAFVTAANFSPQIATKCSAKGREKCLALIEGGYFDPIPVSNQKTGYATLIAAKGTSK